MAKMKVHELAKTLELQSKDVLAFLQNKGIEAKAAQSSVDDHAVEMVTKHFRKSAEPNNDRKHMENITKPMTEAELRNEGKNEERGDDNSDTPKKKKKIIFVSNPQNSKISGKPQQQQAGQKQQQAAQKPQNNQNSQGNRDRRTGQGQNNQRPGNKLPKEAPYRPIRPLTPPSPTPPVTMITSPQQPAKKEVKPTQRLEETVQKQAEDQVNSAVIRNTESRSSESRGTDARADQGFQDRNRDRNDHSRKEGGARPAHNSNNAGGGARPAYHSNNAGGGARPAYHSNNAGGGARPAYNSNNASGGARPAYHSNNANGGNTRSAYNSNGGGTRPGGNTTARPNSYQNNRNDAGRNSQYSRPDNRPGYRTDNRNENRTNEGRPGETRPNNNSYGRSDFRRPGEGGQGDRRPYAGGTGNNRSFGNNDRSGRSNAGADNKFKKPAPGKSFVPESPGKDIEKHRSDENRRLGQEKDKRSRKDLIYEDDDQKAASKKAGRFIKPDKKVETAQEEQIKTIIIPDSLTIKELADKMKLQPSAIIKKLFLQGQIVTVNSVMTFEEAENIAIDYEIICEREIKVDVIEELLKEEDEEQEELTQRAPVICVMGHVDHGKTSLLDAIRKTNVTDKEAGGITQHIGAYTVNVHQQKITFLDTPGHEAFTAMRMRGANATDIAILVVAADDGVMPQTVEAINHAKAAGIEIVVAVNKIDKPNANMDRVKQEMTEYELIPVDWGGTTEFVPVSAKTGEGIETLLETILITAEILELKANPTRKARGLVIEAELDKGRGPVATVLVQKGTLRVGDFVSAGSSHGKVRAMIDDKGRRVKEAMPSTPVEILGLSDVPSAGEVFIAHDSDKIAKTYAETYQTQNKERMLEDTKAKMSLDDLFTQIQAGNLKELNIIIKADVQGSVEAVKQSLMKLTNEEVVVKCIHGGVGAINESDVSLASASSAIIIGFNVRPDATAKTISEREGVDIRLYKVIYQAIEDIEAAMKGMLDPVFEEKIIGHAEVRQIFKASAIGNIAGSYVLDGMFQRDCKVRITREGKQVFEGALSSLKRFKDDVKEVKTGYECGFVFDGFDQMQELDIVEAYIMVEVPR